jgi:hypothetical protein
MAEHPCDAVGGFEMNYEYLNDFMLCAKSRRLCQGCDGDFGHVSRMVSVIIEASPWPLFCVRNVKARVPANHSDGIKDEATTHRKGPRLPKSRIWTPGTRFSTTTLHI